MYKYSLHYCKCTYIYNSIASLSSLSSLSSSTLSLPSLSSSTLVQSTLAQSTHPRSTHNYRHFSSNNTKVATTSVGAAKKSTSNERPKAKKFFGPPPHIKRSSKNLEDQIKDEDVSLDDPELKALGIDEAKLDELSSILKSGKHPAKLGYRKPPRYSIPQNPNPEASEEDGDMTNLYGENFYDPILSHMSREEIEERYKKMSEEELVAEFERQYQVFLEHSKKQEEQHEAMLNQPIGRLPSREELVQMIDSMFAIKVRDRNIYPSYAHYDIKKQLIDKMKVIFKNWKEDDVEITPRRVYWALFSNLASIGSKVLKTEEERISILCPEAPFVGETVPFPQFPEIPVTHKRYFTTSKRPPPSDVSICEEIDISSNETKPYVDPTNSHKEKHVDEQNRPIRYAIAKDGGIHQLAIQYRFPTSLKLMEIRYRLCADDVERLGLFSSPTARISSEYMAHIPTNNSILGPNPVFGSLPQRQPDNPFPYPTSSTPPPPPPPRSELSEAAKIAAMMKKNRSQPPPVGGIPTRIKARQK